MMMEYKKFIGHVEYDDDAEIFHGEVVNVPHVITFQGTSPKGLKKAFQESVNVYLNYCKSKGIEPAKPYSGRFVVRMNPELHQPLAVQAKQAHKSLIKYICDKLEAVTT